MLEPVPRKSKRKRSLMYERIDLLIRLANEAKNHSEYEIARHIFAYLIYQYFWVFVKQKLIFLESMRPQVMVIPAELREWILASFHSSHSTQAPYLDFKKYASFPKETKQVWGLLQRSGRSNLVTLLSPYSDERLCIPTPRLKGRVRGMLYTVAEQVPRHTSTRVTTLGTSEVQEILRRKLGIMTSRKVMERAVRHVLNQKHL